MTYRLTHKLFKLQQQLALLLIFSISFSSSIVIAGDLQEKHGTAKIEHNEMGHGDMNHEEVDVSMWPEKPSLKITAHKDWLEFAD